MTNAKLILHIGGGKTGSSYLQHCLSVNSEYLARAGICYPELVSLDAAREGNVTSGNAGELRQWLTQPGTKENKDPRSLLDTIVSHATENQDILISSESLQKFKPDKLRYFREVAHSYGFDIFVIYYVRSVAGRLFSSYAQRVKRHLETQPFEKWIEKNGYSCARITKRLADTLPNSHFTIRNYDTVREHLWQDMLTALNCDPTTMPAPPQLNVNRSLSALEIEYMREINKFLNTESQSKFAGYALMKSSNVDQSLIIRQNEYDLMCKNFSKDVEYLNKFLAGDEKLGILSSNDTLGHREPDQITDRERALLALISEIVKTVKQ